ncbi:MAG: hypothetical protein PWP23_2234 [Candidatus Sumerlaeota bacterium]|nr:hypothetical protein [Candidatus Sumerlaeota bacterium]
MRHAVLTLVMAILMAMAAPASAFVLTPLDEGRVVVELTTQGASREAAIEKAKTESVLGSVGRIFLSDKLLLADDLLVKYLTNYSNDFVTAVEVLDEQFVAGHSEVKARVYVNFDKLQNDLEQKKFLYKPAYKPRFTTFMTERLEGRISSQGMAREALTGALNNLGMRPYEGELTTPPSTTDVAGDAFLLNAAIISSQRAGVEVVVSGECRTRLADKKKLYFDDFWFYDSEMTAAIIRVDTGEVLFKAKGYGSASSKDQDEAIKISIDRAANQAAAALVTDFEKFWPLVVQSGADFEVLLIGVNEELLRIITQNIERLGRETKVHVRKKFDRSAVLSIEYGGGKQDLIDNLKSCPYPTLDIRNPEAEQRFEVQVSG